MSKEYSCGPLGPVDDKAVVAACQNFLEIPSYTGQERELAELVVERLLALGYDSAWTDGVGNVIGEIRGHQPGPKVLFDGHIDTIPVSGSEVWSKEPFEGIIENERIYGRGIVSMKGALAAMLYGLAPLQQYKNKLAGSVFFSGTVGKEQFEGLAFRQVVQVVKPDYVIVGEASDLAICHGQRGRAQIMVMTEGKAAHSAVPLAGKNAGYMMLNLVHEILRQDHFPADSLGRGSLELVNLASAPLPVSATVPHKCWATFDRYMALDESEEDILRPVHRAIALLKRQDPIFAAEVGIVQSGIECYTGLYLAGKRFFPGWLLPSEHELVNCSQQALREAGLSSRLSMYSMSTNASYSAGIAKIPTIGFGPGREEDMHKADENLAIKDLIAAAAGYQAIACEILLKSENKK